MSRLGMTLRVWRSHRAASIGLGIVLVLVLFAAIGPLVSSHDPYLSETVHGLDENKLPVGPNATFWLGTDRLFRDELARLAVGGRISLFIGVTATLLATVVGAVVGILAGWFEGRFIDGVLMRIVDIGLAFPFLLLVMAVGASLDKTTPVTILLTLGLTGWLGTARLVRAKTMQIRKLDFVTAAKALGQSTPGILLRHVVPNVAGPLIVVSSVSVAQMILAESVLSFLGGGIGPPTPTWGRMLFEGGDYITARPWMSIAPGAAILLSVLGFNMLGEGLRDALDPRKQ
ncbi:MAG: ABC transporter permease [Deltaproteobacteria bacterium]|nr:ABC transporter permease [Deltaproteobacteria bacterium]